MNTVAAVSGLLDAALSYAARSWRVLPLNGKIPFLTDWPTLATTDEATVRKWFDQQPAPNVGIATGKASNLFVLDVDPRNSGDDTLRALEAQYGELPRTIEVITGGGGRHYYFQYPNVAIGNSAGTLGPGLDVRTDGGQPCSSACRFGCETRLDVVVPPVTVALSRWGG